MKRLLILIISSTLLLVLGCDKADAPKTDEPAAATEGAEPAKADEHAHDHEHGDEEQAHAPAGYEPGSHEDWCGGHGVPESMCTRCNKSLIAGFKATGDWCEEHELPKSQCLACDPNLKIERPPKKAN